MLMRRPLAAIVLATLVVPILVQVDMPAVASAQGAQAERVPQLPGENCGPDPAPQGVPPIGLPINTLSGGGHGQVGEIEINGHHLPDTTDPNGIHIAIIRRVDSRASKRGEIVQCGTAPRDVGGVNKLKDIVSSWQRVAPDGFLTVVSGSRGVEGDAAVDALSQLAETLGIPKFAANRHWLLEANPFSLVGAAGWDAGAGYSNVGANGALSGYLQPNPATTALGFVFGDYPYFSTQSASPMGQGTSNTMVVNGQQITGTLQASIGDPNSIPADGFQVVVVDRRATKIVENRVYITNCVNPAGVHFQCFPFNDSVVELTHFLDQIPSNPEIMLLLQSIGHPVPASQSWNFLTRAIVRLGGTQGIFNTLTPSTSYSLIATPGVPGSTLESVTDASTGQDGTISGILTRDHHDQFVPSLVDANPTVVGGQLLELAYQPDSTWPLRDTAPRRAAIAYVSKHLGLPVTDPNQRYTDLDDKFGSALFTNLTRLDFPGGSVAFSAADFNDVKTELEQEFQWVDKVRSYFDQIRTILTESALIKKGELDSYKNEIGTGVPVPGDPKVTADAFTIYSDLLNVGKSLGVPGSGALAAAVKVAGALTNKKGEDILGNFTSTFNNLAQDLVDRYKESLSAVGLTADIIVTDYGKLQTAATNMTDEKQGWVWTNTIVAQTRTALTLSARQLYAETLLPTGYTTYHLPAQFQDAKTCRILANEPDSAWISHVNGIIEPKFQTVAAADTQAYAIGKTKLDDVYGGTKANPSLTDPLFQPVSVDHPNYLGLSKIRYIEKVLPQENLDSMYCHPK